MKARAGVFSLALVVAAGGGLLLPKAVAAQEDFRAADPDRPIQVEDAYPVKLREWELETGARGAWSEAGNEAQGSLELKTGILLDTQAGLELEGVWTEDDGGGLAGGALHVLHNFNRETWSWPASRRGSRSRRRARETPDGTGGGPP